MEVGGAAGSGGSAPNAGQTVSTSTATIPVQTASGPEMTSASSETGPGGHTLDTVSDDPLAAIMNQTIFGGELTFKYCTFFKFNKILTKKKFVLYF